MRKIILPVLLFAMIIFTSCRKEEIRALQMYFGGVVLDDCTGEPIEGVDLTLQTHNGIQSTISDENGYFSFGNQYMGSYDLVMRKPGYLNYGFNIQPDYWYENDNVYNLDYFDEYWLTPLSERLTANVYKQFGEGIPTAASNIPFTIYLGEYNDPVEATTDQFGYIEVDSLPMNDTMIANFDFMLGNVHYKEKIKFTSEQDAFVVNGYNPEGNFGIASVNLLDPLGEGIDDFGLDEMIEVTFTQPVDTSMGDPFGVQAGFTNYTLNVDWSMNNMHAAISTPDGWVEDTDHTLNISATNEMNTQAISRTIFFHTSLGF